MAKNKSKPTIALFRLSLAGVAILLLPYLLLSMTDPWALSLNGAKTLTGKWHGEIVLPTGRAATIEFDIFARPPAANSRCSISRSCVLIEGTANYCGVNSIANVAEVAGDVESRDGARFHIDLIDHEDKADQLKFVRISGEWSGDTLSLSSRLIRPADRITRSSTKAADGVEIETVSGEHPDAATPIQWFMQRAGKSTKGQSC